MVETRSQRPTGLRCLKSTPWGTHLCQFYKSKDELIDLVADFLGAGLKEKEFCVWIVPKGISIAKASEALEERIEHFEKYLLLGQIELIAASRWYYEKNGRAFNSQRSLKKLVNAYADHMTGPWSGVRAAGDVSEPAMHRSDQKELMAYERLVHKESAKFSALWLCTYNIRSCSHQTFKGLVDSHHYSLIRKGLQWEAIQRNYSLAL